MPYPTSTMRADRGATAIIVAIVAVVIFGFSALAVELTDMFSRDRAVQTTADLAAFAGAQDLPNPCQAFDSALSNMNDPANGVQDDVGPSPFAASAAAMRDGNLQNGEIEVLNAVKAPISPTDCAGRGRFVRVTTPPRTKSFAFGSAIGGADSGKVQAVATVQLRGLDVSVLPLSLPSNCPSGPNYLYVDNGGIAGGPSSSSPNYDPAGNVNGPPIGAVTPLGDPNVPTQITFSVSELREDPSTSGVVFDFHLLRPDGTTLRDPVLPTLGYSPISVAGPVEERRNEWRATFTVAVPPVVRSTPGSWKVRGYQAGGTAKWTADDAVGTVVIGVTSAPGCPNPSEGDFGLLNSPRSDGGSAQQQRFRNFALGLDHPLFEVASPSTDVPCASDGNPYTDGILDDNLPPLGTESCIDVKPGETSALPTDGLIDGRGGEPGRLVGSPLVSPGGDCRVAGDSDLQWTTASGRSIVNTVLSCYLEAGRSLGDVRGGRADSLKQSIADDQRFFFIPVVDTTSRPRNSAGGAQFWPIKEFRGAFITNENSGGDATCAGRDDCNGLLFNNGGRQLKAIQAFTFPLSALPREVDQPGNGGEYYQGGPKDFLLVE